MFIFGESLQRISCYLDREDKGIVISPIVKKGQELNLQLINELQKIVLWCHDHIEVNYLHFKFHVSEFNIPHFCEQKDISELRESFTKLYLQIYRLPQTTIFDFSGKLTSFWSELLSCMDLVISYGQSTFCCDHFKNGVMPIIPPSLLFHSEHLDSSDILYPRESFPKLKTTKENYQSVISNLKKSIAGQSPVARIQWKKSLRSRPEAYAEIVQGFDLTKDWKMPKEFFSAFKFRELVQENLETNRPDIKPF